MGQKSKLKLIVEGKTDEKILKAILENGVPGNPKLDIVIADGYWEALVKAKSYLIQNKYNVILAVDSSAKEYDDEEKKENIESYLNSNHYLDSLKVVMFEPDIESLLFKDKTAFEEALNKNVSDEAWHFSQLNARQALKFHNIKDPVRLLRNKKVLNMARKSKQIKEILKFAKSH